MRTGLVPVSAALGVAWMLCASAAHAEPTQLRYDLWVDGAVTLGAAATLATTQAFASELAPRACRWCDSNGLDDDARSALRWPNASVADRLSSVGAYAIVPSSLVGSLLVASSSDGRSSDLPVDLLLTAEASMLAMAACQAAKFSFGRQRPWVHASSGLEREPQPDDNLSFYSGHTTLAFSIAAASGTIASMRKYRHADWVWFSGMTLATSVGYLRIAGDMHYLTDVVTGAVAGTAFGIAVPYLFHSPVRGLHLAPLPGGLSASGVF